MPDRLPHVTSGYPAITAQHARATEAYIREWDIPGPIHVLLTGPATVNAAVDWWNAGAPNNPDGAGPTPASESLAGFDRFIAAGGQMSPLMTVDQYRAWEIRNDREERAARRAHQRMAAKRMLQR